MFLKRQTRLFPNVRVSTIPAYPVFPETLKPGRAGSCCPDCGCGREAEPQQMYYFFEGHGDLIARKKFFANFVSTA